jgi:hypothetical protein
MWCPSAPRDRIRSRRIGNCSPIRPAFCTGLTPRPDAEPLQECPSDERPPPWLPDWRDVTGYPDPKAPIGTTSSQRWRWEFQRRDPGYQRDWTERTDRPAGFWRERYGLTKPIDPASPRASFAGAVYWIQPRGAGDRRFVIVQGSGTALIQFDLTRPLMPQFKWAEFTLQPWMLDEADVREARVDAGFLVISARRYKGFQWRPRDWQRYLRLLDADASGASKDEIVDVLYPRLTNKYPERMQDSHLRDDRRAAWKLLKDRKFTLL